jgi:hypothetical protein
MGTVGASPIATATATFTPDSHCHSYCDSNVHTYADANSDRTVQPDANTIIDFYANSDCGTWRN